MNQVVSIQVRFLQKFSFIEFYDLIFNFYNQGEEIFGTFIRYGLYLGGMYGKKFCKTFSSSH